MEVITYLVWLQELVPILFVYKIYTVYNFIEIILSKTLFNGISRFMLTIIKKIVNSHNLQNYVKANQLYPNLFIEAYAAKPIWSWLKLKSVISTL